MESERPHLANQPRERPIRYPPRARRLSEQFEISLELAGLTVAVRQPALRAVKSRRHERQLAAKRLLFVARPAGGHIGHRLTVGFERGIELGRDEQPRLRLGEPLGEPVHPRSQQPQRGRPVQA